MDKNGKSMKDCSNNLKMKNGALQHRFQTIHQPYQLFFLCGVMLYCVLRKLLNKGSIFVIYKSLSSGPLDNNYIICHSVICCNAGCFFNCITDIVFSNIVCYSFLKLCYLDGSSR